MLNLNKNIDENVQSNITFQIIRPAFNCLIVSFQPLDMMANTLEFWFKMVEVPGRPGFMIPQMKLWFSIVCQVYEIVVLRL